MKQNNCDEILLKALTLNSKHEASSVPKNDEIDHVFSEKYLKAKEKLLKRIDKPYYSIINTTAKKVAVIIICFILALSSLLTVDAVREKVLNFLFEVFDTNITVFDKNSNVKKNIDTYYTLPFVPDEYIINLEDKTIVDSVMIWKSGEEKEIYFLQKTVNGFNNIDNKNAEIKESVVNDTPFLSVKLDYAYTFYWEFDGYSFTLTYPLDLGEEFAEGVIGKLVKVEE